MSQDVTINATRRTGTVEITIEPAVVTERTAVEVVEVPDEVVVITGPVEQVVEVISTGVQGPQGPPGVSGSGGNKFSATVGDGVSLTYPITHNMNSRDVEVQVYRVAAPQDEIFPEVQHSTVNVVTVVFSPAPAVNQFRVVVMG